MPIKTEAFAVTTVAARIASGGTITDPVRVTLAAAAADVQIGGADVTVAGGLTFKSTDPPLTLDLATGDDLYVIAAGATTVRVLRTRS